MRHRRDTKKIGRLSAHRTATIASVVCGLISKGRVTTTLAKARLARVLADKVVTLAKKGTLSARRKALSDLRREGEVADLFSRVVSGFGDRKGGYTRVIKLGERRGDGALMAVIEWVNAPAPVQRRKKKSSSDKESA